MELSGKGSLPENAYRKLKEGETYEPIIRHDQPVPEITTRSVVWGLIMSAIFSASAAFAGLKVGTVFEAAIPIAILAIGLSAVLGALGFRKSSLLENVIIQSIGSSSGVIVAGAIFTLPALFILGLDASFFKFMMVGLFGGFIGILFMILFRTFFVADMHGEFPFPEGTATTEVLVAGEKGGKQAKTLVVAMLFSGIFDFLVLTCNSWAETFSSRMFPLGAKLAGKAKLVFKYNGLAFLFGLGYIVGVRYAAIICAGSFLSWFILVPIVGHFGQYAVTAIAPVTDGTLISSMSAEQIFSNYVRLIGIGGIAAAGMIGIAKSWRIIWDSLTKGIKQMFASKSSGSDTQSTLRTNLDIKMSYIFLILAALFVGVFLFFRFSVLSGMEAATFKSVVALLIVFIIAFLFTTVAARAIAIVGMNPVSGMTLMTLILSSVILVQIGLKGTAGMVAVLLIGGVVCTALSMSGAFISDLKIGYWIGATPRNQERWKFLGTIVAALCVSGVIFLLNDVYGFVITPEHTNPFPAPQANAMAAVIQTLMSDNPVPWLLYGVGILMALTLEVIKIPPLAFVLGMYLPLELNTPLLMGGIIAYLVGRSSKNEEVTKARKDKGILIASGFIAGGALMGVVGALLKYFGWDSWLVIPWATDAAGHIASGWHNYIAVIMTIGLLLFVYHFAKSAKKES